ncbi:MAG: hypothetical protein V2A79_09795 [Planctomycetota bacterium]
MVRYRLENMQGFVGILMKGGRSGLLAHLIREEGADWRDARKCARFTEKAKAIVNKHLDEMLAAINGEQGRDPDHGQNGNS